MPTTTCSHCHKQIDALPLDETDTMVDWQCPNCGHSVLMDGNAKEQQRQQEAREQITEQILELASELDTPNYQPAPYTVEELKHRLEDLVEDIDTELQQRPEK
jgi:DNA-directed RNA polymerase subunit RPC12/RpoP